MEKLISVVTTDPSLRLRDLELVPKLLLSTSLPFKCRLKSLPQPVLGPTPVRQLKASGHFVERTRRMKMSALTVVLAFSHFAATSEVVTKPKAPSKPAWNLKQGQRLEVSFTKYSYPAGRDAKRPERASRVQQWTVESIDPSGVVNITATPEEDWVPSYRLQLHPSGKIDFPKKLESPDWFPVEYILKYCVIPIPTFSYQSDGTLMFGNKLPEEGHVTEYRLKKPFDDSPNNVRIVIFRSKNARFQNCYTHEVEYDTKTGLPKQFRYRLVRTRQKSRRLVIDLRYSVSIRPIASPTKK